MPLNELRGKPWTEYPKARVYRTKEIGANTYSMKFPLKEGYELRRASVTERNAEDLMLDADGEPTADDGGGFLPEPLVEHDDEPPVV